MHQHPNPQCRAHSFCDFPHGEDHANAPASDLKHYVKSLSPNKRVDLLQREIPSTSNNRDLDIEYLRSIEPQMDHNLSVKKGVPLVTYEGLSDWCQQSIQRYFPTVPAVRPFMMSDAVYDFLRDVQDRVSGEKKKAQKPQIRGLLAQSELDEIMNRKPKKLFDLEPRIIEGGMPFLHTKIREVAKKPKQVEVADPESKLPSYMRSVKRRASRSPTRRHTRSVQLSRAVSLFKEAPRSAEPKKQKPRVSDSTRAHLFITLASGMSTARTEPKALPEFATPTIEEDESEHSEDELNVHPTDLSPSHRDRFEMQDSIVWFVRAHDQARKGKWNIAIDSYKQALKLRPDFTICEFNLACCLEKIGCWQLSRRWFAKVFRVWPTHADVLYGLAVCSFKLGQYGDAALFAERGLELASAREKFYYILAATKRILGQIGEATDYYAKLLAGCHFQRPETTHTGEVLASDATELFSAIRKSQVKFFQRLGDESLRDLLKAGEMQSRAQGSLLILQSNEACILLKGQACARCHAGDAIRPTVLWCMTAGDFVTSHHRDIVGSAEVWSRFETESAVLLVPENKLADILHKEKVTQKDILVKTFQAFPLFSDLHETTLELLVYDLMEVRTYHEGEVIQRQLSAQSQEAFQVILSGLCTLQVASLHYDATMLGRGDFFCEETLMKGQKGFASAGDIVAKSASVEVARIAPELFYKLPLYEVQKMQQRSSAKGQVEFVLHRIELQRARMRHVRRSTAL